MSEPSTQPSTVAEPRFEPSTLVELCRGSVERFSTRPLFGTKKPEGWVWTTYAEFGQLVDQCRAGLAALGVRTGDRVAIVSNNRLEWPVLAFATFGLGAALVPMYESQRPEEWVFILRDSGAKLVVAATENIRERLEKVRGSLTDLENVLGLELPEGDIRSFGALLRTGKAAPVPSASPSPDSIACLIYTSGTTGDPKGVMLSHRNIASNVTALCSVFPIGPEDRSLAFLPWAHAYGQTCEVHIMMNCGASTAINDKLPSLIENLGEVKPTILVAVPRIFNRLYDNVMIQLEHRPKFIRRLVSSGLATASRVRKGDPISVLDSAVLTLVDRLVFSKVRERFGGRLKYAISGSAALSGEIAEFIDAIGLSFYEGYGLSETSPIATANVPGARKLGSVGKPLPGVRIAIDERAGLGTGPGEGEIIVYGPNVMLGYYHRPEEQAGAMTPDGGLKTGDLGYLDAEGYLFITGRLKDQYKLSNGKYVMPGPLEEALGRSHYIANVMLYGANKPYSVALVAVNAEAIRVWAKERGFELGDIETDPRVHELIDQELRAHSEDFKGYERPQGFLVTTQELTPENGFLTPTLKLKRRIIVSSFGDRLEALYAAPSTARAVPTSPRSPL